MGKRFKGKTHIIPALIDLLLSQRVYLYQKVRLIKAICEFRHQSVKFSLKSLVNEHVMNNMFKGLAINTTKKCTQW